MQGIVKKNILKLVSFDVLSIIYCVKSVQMRRFFWSVFLCTRTEYRKIQTKNNFVFGQFSRSDIVLKLNEHLPWCRRVIDKRWLYQNSYFERVNRSVYYLYVLTITYTNATYMLRF